MQNIILTPVRETYEEVMEQVTATQILTREAVETGQIEEAVDLIEKVLTLKARAAKIQASL